METQFNTDVAQFTNDFAPVPSKSNSLKIAIDILTMAFGLAMPPFWNSCKKLHPS